MPNNILGSKNGLVSWIKIKKSRIREGKRLQDPKKKNNFLFNLKNRKKKIPPMIMPIDVIKGIIFPVNSL
ncbi:MAG: hypothetical protein ACQES9_06910 [Myxococcota bacterium]